MKTLKKIVQQTNNKHLNLFNAIYEIDGQDYNYQFCLRNDMKNLATVNKKPKTNVVRIVPYFRKQGKTYIVLIKEFRYPINRFIYSLPAGLVDENELPSISAKRELLEETGFETKNLQQTETLSYISAGMSDENCVCFEAEVENQTNQNLIGNEKIVVKIVEAEKLDKLLDNKEFDLQSKLLIKLFICKEKIKNLENLSKKEK